MKIFVTKYALTQGILVMEAEQKNEHLVLIPAGNNGVNFFCSQYFHRGEWFKTREEAIVKAEDMRQRKLRSLQKQITKLQKIQFIYHNI